MCFLWIETGNKPWSKYTSELRRQQEKPGLSKTKSDPAKQLIVR